MTRLVLKEGVEPPMLALVAALINAAQQVGVDAVRITAAINGAHQRHSKHYQLAAIDVGCKEFAPETKAALLAACKQALGRGYDCFIEAAGTENEHFHFEYDPR